MLKHPPKLPKVNWGEREPAPTCRLDSRVVMIDSAYVHRYLVCAMLRANVASQISGINRVNPAESAFNGPNAMVINDLGLQTRGRHAFPASAR